MLSKCIILFFLPVVAFCRVDINMTVSAIRNDIKIDISGEDIAVVSNRERYTFKLTDKALKDASGAQIGRKCDDMYLKEPTPWYLYRQYNWKEVERIFKPVHHKILSTQSKQVAVATSRYMNRSNVTARYGADLNETVDDIVKNDWSIDGQLTIGQKINYNFNVGADNTGNTISFNYAANWNEGTTKEKKISLGTVSNVEIEVPANHGVLAKVMATRGSIDVEIEYQATLEGNVACNFYPQYEGHHFYALNLHKLFPVLPVPTIKSKEVISIDFYTGFKTEIIETFKI